MALRDIWNLERWDTDARYWQYICGPRGLVVRFALIISLFWMQVIWPATQPIYWSLILLSFTLDLSCMTTTAHESRQRFKKLDASIDRNHREILTMSTVMEKAMEANHHYGEAEAWGKVRQYLQDIDTVDAIAQISKRRWWRR